MCRASLLLTTLFAAGCHTQPVSSTPVEPPPAVTPVADITPPPSTFDADVELYVSPPDGWRLDPVKRTAQHTHKTWISPTGHTAYGVIRFRLPIPVSDDLALWGFLREMRRTEGEAVLLDKTPNVPLESGVNVLSFTAEGGLYRVRTLLVTRGFRGWCVYAGTLRAHPIQAEELEVALRHRNALKLP